MSDNSIKKTMELYWAIQKNLFEMETIYAADFAFVVSVVGAYIEMNLGTFTLITLNSPAFTVL